MNNQTKSIDMQPAPKKIYEKSNERFCKRYLVHSLIRNSTNGVIYAAFDQQTHKNVVMKQIRKHPKANGRIPREIVMHMHASAHVDKGVVKLYEW